MRDRQCALNHDAIEPAAMSQIAPPIPAHRGHHRQASTWQMLLECLPTSVADPGGRWVRTNPPPLRRLKGLIIRPKLLCFVQRV